MGLVLDCCSSSYKLAEEDSTERENVVLNVEEKLLSGQCVYSGRSLEESGMSVTQYIYLRLQEDGDLVLYSPTFIAGQQMKVYWRSETDQVGTKPYYLILEPDANLVLYDSMQVVVWESNSRCRKITDKPRVVLNMNSFEIRMGNKTVWHCN